MSYVTLMDDSKTLAELFEDRSDGLGVLSCSFAVCEEELNGMYILNFSVSVLDKHFNELHEGSVVRAKPNETSDEQLFRVVDISTPIFGVVDVIANHISYDLNYALVMPFENVKGILNALSAIKANVQGSGYVFNLATDLTNTEIEYQVGIPSPFRTCLGGAEGSILDRFGGEFEWDNQTIHVWKKRGSDNGVNIEYGKNLVDAKKEINIEEQYDGVIGYAKAADNNDQRKEKIYTGDLQMVTVNDVPVQTDTPRVKIVDFSDKYEGEVTPTKASLNTFARLYINENKVSLPKVNLTIKFIQLHESEEYKNIAPLEHVSLGDTVHVHFSKLGINVSLRVIKTKYNVLADRYESVDIGDHKSNLGKTISGISSSTSIAISKSETARDKALKHATSLISGDLGGHIVLGYSEDGYPNKIMIMDTDDLETAKQVMMMSKDGIGFAENYQRSKVFNTAWTIDGTFIADYILAGTLDCDKLRTNTDFPNGDVKNMDAEQVNENMLLDPVIPGKVDEDITIVNWNGYLCHYVYNGRRTNYWVEEHEDYYWRNIYTNAGGHDDHG